MTTSNKQQPTPFAAAFDQANLPGAVGIIVDRHGTRFAQALGVADVTSGAAMQQDTRCQVASMTKAIASVAAMQLVERGLLTLDEDIGAVLPELAAPQVLTGFDADGMPQTRPAKRPLTLRHLLTHTAGFGYSFIHQDVLRIYSSKPAVVAGSREAIRMPLMFDPGERWEYSVATDWVGLAVEAASGQTLGEYLSANITGPLGMADTSFENSLPADAARVHARLADGLTPVPFYIGGGEFESGGGGLISTAPDYARFVRMILNSGELDGARILAPETVAEMARNQVGQLRAGAMGSTMPQFALPFDTFPDQHTGWGLGFLINPQTGPNGRSPGSLAWAGALNSYYWIDPAAGIGGVFMSQLTPFGDEGALACFGALERMAYAKG